MKDKKRAIDYLKEFHPYFSMCLCAYACIVLFFRVMESFYPEFHGVMATIFNAFDILSSIKGGNALDPTEWANYWQ